MTRCPRCSYQWSWRGKLWFAQCPRCKKTFKPMEEEVNPDHDEWGGMQE